MKKSALFLLPVLLLASCSSYNEKAVIASSKEAVAAVTTTDKTKYTVKPEGHVLQFNTFINWEDKTYDVPSGVVEGEELNLGRSHALRAPIRLTAENYYPSDDNYYSYGYGLLKEYLASDIDAKHFLQFKKDGDNLVFYSNKVSKEGWFYNVDVGNGSKKKPVTVYSRFNYVLTYNKEGLLMTEQIQSTNLNIDSAEMTVDYRVTYTYNA